VLAPVCEAVHTAKNFCGEALRGKKAPAAMALL
jgi:hypothetical protein